MLELIAVKGEPDATRKCCVDCFYCRGAVSLWCINKEAVKYRGTQIPGVRNCHFWKPIRKVSDLGWFEWVGYLLFGWLTTVPVDCTTLGKIAK